MRLGLSRSGAEQFDSPRLPDQVAELPAGSDAVDPADVPGTAWADLTGVPVEVRAADEVTVLPESPDAAATTEPLPAAESEPVPVEVTVEPSGEGQTPALFVDIDKTTEAAAEPTLPGIPTLPVSGVTLESTATNAVDDWPVLSGILRDAAKGKGNFGIGAGTASQAERAGAAWVGKGYTIASDGKTLVSRNGLRQWRPPSYKPNLGKWQSNFESRLVPRGQWQGNGHLDITDLP